MHSHLFDVPGAPESHTGRTKRQVFIDECAEDRLRQACVVFYNSCYFVVQCASSQDQWGRESAGQCKTDHIYDNVRKCVPCCLDKVQEGNPSPHCYDEHRLTREKICPDCDFGDDANEDGMQGDAPSDGTDEPPSNSKLNRGSKSTGH